MTNEQFVFWLKGFLKGMKFSTEKSPLSSILEEELQKIGAIQEIINDKS